MDRWTPGTAPGMNGDGIVAIAQHRVCMWGAEAGSRAVDLRRRLREVEGTAGPGTLVSMVEGTE
eukprot:3370440-Alexandrium_andersonii.AAC.1